MQEHLARFGVPFRENPRIVRGLDYYGHTAFEFVTTKLGAQGTVMAGGRYDGLVAEMGGPPTPAVGWAAGIERLAMLLDAPPPAPAPVAVVPIGDEAEAAAIGVLQSLRAAGIRAEMAYRGNLRRRMERANRIDARAAVILGADDLARGVAQVKDLATGAQEAVAAGYRRAPGMNLALKLDRIAARAEELRAMLSDGMSGEAYVKASKELSDIEPVVARIGDLRAAERAQADAEALLDDPEMRELAEAELHELKDQIPAAGARNPLALLPKDEADARSAILEVRPAAGGDEAGLFAAELFAMYQKYAESRGWRFEILEYSDTDLGGLKEAIAEITGRDVFARLKYEFGRASRAARAGDRKPGAHPHLHRHRRRAAGSGGSRCPDRRGRSAHRRLPRVRRRRPARQQDRKRGAHHPSSDRHRGDDAGGEEPAQEPRQGDEDPARPAVRAAARRAACRRAPPTASRRSAPAIAASASAPTISRRAA